jgi:flagella basal body P-ring formation protein FlgA
MPRPLQITLMTLLLMVCGIDARADSGTDSSTESLDRIREVARAFATQQADAGTQVQVSALDSRLRLPACAQEPQAFAPAGSSGRGALTIGVRCDAPMAWSIYVPVRISETRRVLVLRRALARGEVINADALDTQERDAVTLPYGYITDAAQVLGKTLRRPLAPGSVIAPDAVESARIIKRGQIVTLVSRAGAVEVRAQGTAMGDGGVGDRLTVQNSASRRTVEGVVSAADTVEVHL